MRTSRVGLLALAALFFIVACRADSSASTGLLPSPVPPPVRAGTPAPVAVSPADPSPSPKLVTPTPAPTPAKPVVVPRVIAVYFSGLRAGTYPVHLHSACNGSQAFHIMVLQSLVVHPGGAGSISVASSSFGRGLCLIVYGSSSLRTVVTVRRI